MASRSSSAPRGALRRPTRARCFSSAHAKFLRVWKTPEDAARGRDSLRGLIRLALPVIYGTREVIPRLAEFLAAHPLLRVEMTIADERQDLIAEGADVAIRLGPLQDSAFGARKLGTLERLLVASPSYLKARGVPRTPADLTSHDCIIGPRAFGQSSWIFRKGDSIISVDVTGRISTDSGPASSPAS